MPIWVIKPNQLIQYKKIIAVCRDIHTKHINTLCGRNVELFNVKPGGIAGLYPQCLTSFWMTTFSASLTNLTPPSSVTWSQQLRKQTNTQNLHRSDFTNTPIYTHTTSRTPPTCDIRLAMLMLPAPETGDFVELILRHMTQVLGFKGWILSRWRKIIDKWTHNLNFIMNRAWRLHNQSHIMRKRNKSCWQKISNSVKWKQ